MRIIVASDIHGRILAAKKLDKLFLRYNPDKIILLGDYLYNGPRNGVPADYDPMGVSIILNKYANLITGVRGNCDSRIDAMLLKFPMEDSRVVYLNGFRCDLVHGDLLTSDVLDVQRGDILMFGHTHVYM
ncbi:MAG TPA: phosphodiesterase [Firmicutes bacterium]|nr:phosphodiesterase [Bacillota bacterium]